MNDPSFIRYYEYPDGRYLAVTPLTFDRARVVVGRGMSYDDSW